MINEKAMFTTISWSSYVTAIGTLLFIWYVFLGFRFYFIEIKQVLLGQRKITFPILGMKKSNNLLVSQSKKETFKSNLSESFSESFATLDEVKELSARIIDATSESAERNLSQQEFKNFLKLILDEYPYVKISSLRRIVNDLIVSESEKYTNLVMTLEQADDLWNQTV